MNDILLNLIVLAVFGGLGILLFIFLQQRKRQKNAQFMQMAKEKGWEVERIQEPLRSGYRLRGKNSACMWTIETLAEANSVESGPGSSDVSHSTLWWSDDITLPDRGLVLGPMNNPGDAKMLSTMGNSIMNRVLKTLVGKDSEWATGLSFVEDAGSDQFRKKYLCLASQKEDAVQMLQPGVEKLLLALANQHKPILKFHANGLEISIPTEQLLDQSSLDLMVNLGKVCVESWEGGKQNIDAK